MIIKALTYPKNAEKTQLLCNAVYLDDRMKLVVNDRRPDPYLAQTRYLVRQMFRR